MIENLVETGLLLIRIYPEYFLLALISTSWLALSISRMPRMEAAEILVISEQS